jgi:hypothetical protein
MFLSYKFILYKDQSLKEKKIMCDITARIRSRIEVDFRICIWLWIWNHIETKMDPKHWYFPLNSTGWYCTSPFAVPGTRCQYNLLYRTIERLDQGHLYPLGERRDKPPPPPAPQADALPKELSRQLISWLFGTSTWAGAAFGPLHGRPSACGVTHGLKLGSRPCKCGKPEPLASPRVSNHVGVTTIERLDQSHLYPLGERRDKHVPGGARTSAPLHRRRTLYLKSYLDSL